MNNVTKDPPLISVIIPVYNGADTLDRAVKSVEAQTFADWELILVDDGSTDESPGLCDRRAKDVPDRIRVLHKENGGLMRAWLDGVRASSGRYLCFIDCDDWVDASMLEKMAAELAIDEASGEPVPGQVVCCGYLIEYGEGKTPKPEGHGLESGVYEGERLYRELKTELLGHERRRVIPSRCMKLIDRELILQNIRFLDTDIHMAEDVNTTVPVLLDASRVVLLSDKLYHYTFVAGSMVHRYDGELYSDCVRLRERLRVILSDKRIPEDPDEQDKHIEREFLFLFLNVLKNEIRRTGRGAYRLSSARIKELCRAENSTALLAAYPDRIEEPANRLLSLLCKRPSGPRIALLRLIFSLYEWFR